ncbi:hypothetical protein [Candidatus Palauibacter soopunensis]|uniref:hypothetical protein n=1 Tax=Candidatus Palauibacter soopunensis TaxID=3056739 RepID=UPI0023907502|nr:hypothetical protein [Candidatus Palauibacter soopunensis]MDE2879925.1 hypothetical protein [Candidatus Palauibacter soopunensis]
MWLDFALDMERKKHAAVPIRSSPIGDWEAIQAWGYITTAYVLAEQGLKALLHHTVSFDEARRGLRETHRLRCLFDALDRKDRATLNDFYEDYLRAQRAGGPGIQENVASFLDHLDTGRGSVTWRYSIQESAEADAVPHFRHLHLRLLWECIRCVKDLLYYRTIDEQCVPQPHSEIQRGRRRQVYEEWCFRKRHSDGDWHAQDRIELLWGPDAGEHVDFLVIQDGLVAFWFGDPEKVRSQLELRIIDSRADIREFSATSDAAFGDGANEMSLTSRESTVDFGGVGGTSVIQAKFDQENQLALVRYRNQLLANRDSRGEAELQAATDEYGRSVRRARKDRIKAVVELLMDDSGRD